jgi:hypothetical protein
MSDRYRLAVPISSPMQQVAAVVATRDFLLRLSDPDATKRVPGEIRKEARALLRHFPIAEKLRPVLQEGLQKQEEPLLN